MIAVVRAGRTLPRLYDDISRETPFARYAEYRAALIGGFINASRTVIVAFLLSTPPLSLFS
jgi:hypothetical protein